MAVESRPHESASAALPRADGANAARTVHAWRAVQAPERRRAFALVADDLVAQLKPLATVRRQRPRWAQSGCISIACGCCGCHVVPSCTCFGAVARVRAPGARTETNRKASGALPHLHRDWAHPCYNRHRGSARLGSATPAPGLLTPSKPECTGIGRAGGRSGIRVERQLLRRCRDPACSRASP